MRSTIGYVLVSALAAAVLASGVQAQQDTSHVRDSVSRVRHQARRDTMSSNGSVAKSQVKNQDQSGVVNSKGKSTLGSQIKKTTPTQGHPITAKGDTLRGSDSTKMPGKARTRRRADSTAADSVRPH
jgi:ABC-type transporter MlaC component